MLKNCIYFLFFTLTLSFNASAQICAQVFSTKAPVHKNQSVINEKYVKFWQKMSLSGDEYRSL